MGSRSPSSPPSYVEGYPILTAADVVRAVGAGERHCVWKTELGQCAAIGTLVGERPVAMALRWYIDKLAYLSPRDGEVGLIIRHSRVGKSLRPLLECVCCQKGVAKLVLAGMRSGSGGEGAGGSNGAHRSDGGGSGAAWKCQSCHGLKYESQLPAVGHTSEAWAEVRRALTAKRRKGQWSRSYEVEKALHRVHAERLALVGAEEGRRPLVSGPEWGRLRPAEIIEPDQVLERDRFRYIEAYPRLDAAGARHAHLSECNLCIWTVNGAVVGNAVAEAKDEVLTVRYAVQRTTRLGGARGEARFPIRLQGSDPVNKRWLLVCPGCEKAKGILALVGDRWACRTCLGLAHRSDLVGTAVRRSEKLSALRLELQALRARGARPAAIARQQELIASLRAKVAADGPTPVANAEFEHIADAEWVNGAYEESGFYKAAKEAPAKEADLQRFRVTVRTGGPTVNDPSTLPRLDPYRVEKALRNFDGKRLFARQFLEDYLEDLFAKSVEFAVQRHNWAAKRQPNLARMVAREAALEPLVVGRSPSSVDTFQDSRPTPQHAPLIPQGQKIVRVCFEFHGDARLWECAAPGFEHVWFRGDVDSRTSVSCVTLTAVLPRGAEDEIFEAIGIAGQVLHAIVDAQAPVVRAYNDRLPKRAAEAVAQRREEALRLKNAEEWLRNMKF